MLNPISNTAKERLRKHGIILLKPLKDVPKSMAAMVEWETEPYNIFYSAKSDQMLHLFTAEITVSRKIAALRNLSLPERSDLIKDEPMMTAMMEYTLEKFAKWGMYLKKKWAIADSCLPHFDVALRNTGYAKMVLGTMENTDTEIWHRGRKLLEEEK